MGGPQKAGSVFVGILEIVCVLLIAVVKEDTKEKKFDLMIFLLYPCFSLI